MDGQTDQLKYEWWKFPNGDLQYSFISLLRLIVVGIIVTAKGHINYPYYHHFHSYHPNQVGANNNSPESNKLSHHIIVYGTYVATLTPEQ